MAEVTQILCPICHKPNLRRARFCQHCGHDVVLNNAGPRYYITRVIKAGGQGAVYETIDDDGKVYAVKEMLDRFVDPKERTEAIGRFEAEAKMLERLRHPRIPRIYAHFKDEGRHYLAMDFVRGEDLEEVLARDGAIPEPQVLEWADQICDVLDYLHRNGLIYRDMKPSNVMLDHQNGGVKLVDFGIAKVFQRAERGTQIGTPGYAPPEQYQGIATPESDIFALGATLHHMLTGRDPRDHPPFSFPLIRDLKPSVSQRTADAIPRALQINPGDRYRSVAEFRAALRPQPAAPPQIRRAPAAVAAQPSVASPPPAQPTPQVAPAPPPIVPAPPRQAPAPRQAAPQPAPAPRRRSCLGCVGRALLTLLVLTLVAGGLFVAFPDTFGQYLPGVQPTPQTLVAQPFVVNDMEVIVPAGTDAAGLRQAFTAAYTRAAQDRFGAGTIISSNVPPTYIGGEPQPIGQEPDGGVKYRASMQGFVVPRP